MMKRQAYTMIAMMIVLLVCGAESARAQCRDMPLIANIPFQFNVGNKTLPAGEYKLTCLDPNGLLLLIGSTDGKANAVMQMVSVSSRSQDGGKLVFHRYGSRYFFVQAWVGGDTGLGLPTTHAERTVARGLAGLRRKSETITLTARQ